MFGKDDLRSCDVVVRRDGCLGIVVKSGNELVIVYQTGGFDTLDEFDDDLLNATHFEDEKQFDIMAVYRSPGVGNGFKLYYEEKHREERKRCDAQRAAECSVMPKRDVIHVMVQAFYGNRVITMADTEKVDQLIHGNPTYMDMEVDRKTVHLTQYDLQIYSRPLACRMDESGKLLNIEEEDIEIICRYFAE